MVLPTKTYKKKIHYGVRILQNIFNKRANNSFLTIKQALFGRCIKFQVYVCLHFYGKRDIIAKIGTESSLILNL